MHPELLEAWCHTDYVVRLADRQLVFRLGVMNAANDKALTEQRITRWAIVTAWNPGSQPCSDEKNDIAHRQLVEELRKRERSWSPGDGHPPDEHWPIERGCFIHNISAEEASELCRQFGQLAAVVGRPAEQPRLVFAEIDVFRRKLESIATTHPEDVVRRVIHDALQTG